VKLDQAREEKRLLHWQSVAISACEQSGRNRVPSIAPVQTLSDWMPQIKSDHAFVLSPVAETKLAKESLRSLKTPVVLLIGPEGGLSDQEITRALQHGFSALNLGPRVLRTETASLAAIAVLQYAFGDFC
jgi:16S rRNA (uracil1498-N3)-methyltransferase